MDDKLIEIKETDAWPTGKKVTIDDKSVVNINTAATYEVGKISFDYPNTSGTFYSVSPYGTVLLHIPPGTGRYFRFTFTGTETFSGVYSVDVPPSLVTASIAFTDITETPTMILGANVTNIGNTFTADLTTNPNNIGVVTYEFTTEYTLHNYVITPTITNSYGDILNIPLSWSISTSTDGTSFYDQPTLYMDLTGLAVIDAATSAILPAYYTISI